MKLQHRPSTYMWLFAGILLALLVRPIGVEMLGMAGFIESRPGALDSISYATRYSAQDNLTTTFETYHFKDSLGNFYTPSEFAGPLQYTTNDSLTLGIVLGDLATINGEFVGQLDFLARIGFGMMLGLFTFAAIVGRMERYRTKEEANDRRWWAALLLAAIAILPSVPVGLAVVGLSFGAEALDIAPWPLILLAIAALVSYRSVRRITKNQQTTAI